MTGVEEEFEDTKGAIRICKKTDNTITKRKRTNNDLQNITHKTKDQEICFFIVNGDNVGQAVEFELISLQYQFCMFYW